ncbi:MAG: C-GCAxxG-C-C family protein [Desulfobacterales bacterium]
MTMSSRSIKIEIPDNPEWIARVKEKAFTNAVSYGSCTQSILSAFMDEFGIDDPVLMRSAGAMHVGMLTSLTCGIHSAAMMILGLVMGREDPAQGHDGIILIMEPGQLLMKRLNQRLGGHNCLDLTGTDFTDLDQAIAFQASTEAEKCLYRMRDGAEEIARFLDDLKRNKEL